MNENTIHGNDQCRHMKLTNNMKGNGQRGNCININRVAIFLVMHSYRQKCSNRHMNNMHNKHHVCEIRYDCASRSNKKTKTSEACCDRHDCIEGKLTKHRTPTCNTKEMKYEQITNERSDINNIPSLRALIWSRNSPNARMQPLKHVMFCPWTVSSNTLVEFC